MGKQKQNYMQNIYSMKDIEKRKLWEELNDKYKEYMMDRDEIWNDVYCELIKFLKIIKKTKHQYK
jgi:hypothetical protein